MNCREVVDFLMAYLNEELPHIQRYEFEHHIKDCAPCVVYLDTYKDTVKLGKGAFEDPEFDCDEMPDELVLAILEAKKKRSN